MSILPDEIWTKIMEQGVSIGQLNHRDLCSLSITCARIHRLSKDPPLWSMLLSRDFPGPFPTPPSKLIYRFRYERDRARRVSEWKREVLFAESNVAICRKRLEELKEKILSEKKRLRSTMMELSNAERARRASVALNVWQPEVVRGSHNQIVEQCTVPVEAKFSSLNLEISVCKHQIAMLENTYNKERDKLKEGEEVLKSLKYHPLRNYQPGVTTSDHLKFRQHKEERKRAKKVARESEFKHN